MQDNEVATQGTWQRLLPLPKGTQKPRRWLLQQRALEEQGCRVVLALPIGTTDLLCCKFLYFLLLQNFYPRKRGDVLHDPGRSGIGAKQVMTCKQKRQ